MVRMSTIDDDYYHYEEKRYRITGRRTGTVYQLGDKVKVGILKVDITANEMDLFIASSKKEKSSKRKKSTGKKRYK